MLRDSVNKDVEGEHMRGSERTASWGPRRAHLLDQHIDDGGDEQGDEDAPVGQHRQDDDGPREDDGDDEGDEEDEEVRHQTVADLQTQVIGRVREPHGSPVLQ